MEVKQGKYIFRFRRLKSAQRCVVEEIVHDVIREIVEKSEVNKQEEKASMGKEKNSERVLEMRKVSIEIGRIQRNRRAEVRSSAVVK